MLIVGNGFISSHFSPLREKHNDVLLFGSGVSNSLSENAQEFRREADLLYSAIHYCLDHNLRIIYFSSAGMVYGNYAQSVREDSPMFPRTAYGRHKLAMESVIRHSAVRHLILRLSNPIGKNQQRHQLLPSLYEQVKQGFVEIWKGAHRDIIDIEDVVRLTDALLSTGIERETFNLASGHAIAVEDIVNYLEQRMSTFVLKNYIDRGDAYQVCIEKLKHTLSPEFTNHFNSIYYQSVIEKYIFK